ncbi:MAG: VOC family protein [Candidatus Eremiobacteraeota bacterium]|nr:VOC family protein [Candidatus Eremiobacteraeota bacterium]
MSVPSVAFVMYPISDMARAVAFYQDALGFKKSGVESEAWVEFDVAGTTFGVGNFEQVGKVGSAQSLALEVDDLPGFRKTLTERGVESSEPFQMPSCAISVVKDPDGNQIWLHQISSDRKS